MVFFMNNFNPNITAERLIEIGLTLQSIIDELTANTVTTKKRNVKSTHDQLTAKYLNILNKTVN